MLDSWHSYPKVFALGHGAIEGILQDGVLVEEKVDGSQFSFGKFLDENGIPYLRCRSKGAQINVLAPDNMFGKGVATAQELFDSLNLGWTYRGEYLQKPKHNVLAYDRVPDKNVILFDVSTGNEAYLSRDDKEREAVRLGLEIVPVLHDGPISDMATFRALLDTPSILGGQKVEGVVAKNYKRFSADGKAMMGKFVSESFKEVHAADWKERNPKQGDILETLVGRYRTPARWAKALQHLTEAGQIEHAPRDIAVLMPEATRDLREECEAEIKDALFQWAWPHIRRGSTAGLPEWYKEELLKAEFNEPVMAMAEFGELS